MSTFGWLQEELGGWEERQQNLKKDFNFTFGKYEKHFAWILFYFYNNSFFKGDSDFDDETSSEASKHNHENSSEENQDQVANHGKKINLNVKEFLIHISISTEEDMDNLAEDLMDMDVVQDEGYGNQGID